MDISHSLTSEGNQEEYISQITTKTYIQDVLVAKLSLRMSQEHQPARHIAGSVKTKHKKRTPKILLRGFYFGYNSCC